MKKLFTLLTLLVAMVTSAWAQGTYAVKSGDAAVKAGTAITTVTDITMTYGVSGDNDFKAASDENSLKDVLGATGFCQGNGSNGNLTTGTVYYFEPAKTGTLTVGFVLNANKAFFVKMFDGDTNPDVTLTSFTNKDGEEVKNSDNGTFASGDKVSAKLTGGLVTFDVVAGKKYAVYCTGSKLGYYGFKYTLAPTETYTVTFDAGSNGTCATTSLTETSVGAGVTLPAVVANSGYAFKGWYTAAEGGVKAGIAGETYNPTANITLYAQYGQAINRTGFNTYYVAEGDEIVGGIYVLCDDITMAYDNVTYKTASANGFISNINANYVASVSCDTNGWGVTFTPSSDGLLSVGVEINGGKVFSITNASWFNYNGNQDEGTNGEGITQTSPSAGSINSNSWKPGKKQYTIINIPVISGKSYKFSVSGSKMGFYGFEFTKGASATASAVVGSTGWATFVAPTALDFTGVSDLKAYIVTGHTGTAIDVTQMTGTVPANTPLLLEGVTAAIPVAASSATDVSANKLKAGTGAAVSAEANKTKYALSVEGGKAAFKKIATSATIPAGKAYLEFNEEISAPSLSFDFGGTTGIDEVRGKMEDVRGEYYNLAGQRVAQPTKGLYIVNGKKVILK